MVTTVQHTFREEADHALHKAKQVNHAVLLSYSRRIASLDPLSFFKDGAKKYKGKRFFWSEPGSELTIVGLGTEALFQSNEKNGKRYHDVFEQWERFKKTAFHIHEEEEAAHTAVGLSYSAVFHLIPLKREETNGTGSKKDCSLSPHSC